MPLDPKGFRDVMSYFASGVTVVTTICDGVPHGLTVSAFSSVSLSPPRILICLGNDTDSKPLIDRSQLFAVHILGREHVELGPRFAKLIPDIADPFEGLTYRTEQTGAPILDSCIAWLDCRVESAFPTGDHTIYVGDVVASGRPHTECDPVLYYRRAWRVLDPAVLEKL
jgi:flavin reductase (DIM6/NTAB) family NADH-FMN oxidoreductase RutF